MTIERRPLWMMTLTQAEVIERAALRQDLSVQEFVVEVLARVGQPKETNGLKQMIMQQLEWLLAGKLAERAPYYEQFMDYDVYPFHVSPACGPQIEMTLSALVKLCEQFHLVKPED